MARFSDSLPPAHEPDDRSERTARLLAAAAAATTDEERDTLLNEVIVLNMCVAQAIVRRYRDRGVATEDLEQVAYMALVRSAHRFKVSFGRDFLSYAVPNISGELKRHFRDHGWTVRPPRRIQEAQAKVRAFMGSADYSPDMRVSDVSARLDLPVDDVIEALAATGCFRPASTDKVHPETGYGILDGLGEPCEEYEAVEAREMIRHACHVLSDRDRFILQMRFYEGRTQQEIADRIGVTQMQVSRLLARILRDLHAALTEQPDAEPVAA